MLQRRQRERSSRVTQDERNRKRKPNTNDLHWLVFSVSLVLRGGYAAGRRFSSASLRLCGNSSSVKSVGYTVRLQ